MMRTQAGQRRSAENERKVIVASADAAVRERLRRLLAGMRWQVLEAAGGAETMAHLESGNVEALLLDHWLPDLEASEFGSNVQGMYPGVEVLPMGGAETTAGVARTPQHHELLHALRLAEESARAGDGAAWRGAAVAVPAGRVALRETERVEAERLTVEEAERRRPQRFVPELVGRSAVMDELAEMVRLVAPRTTAVLIEGATGAGKEVVAAAIHRLSRRSGKPFTVLNCAAIPEALLEAELFGHTRGAFTGATAARKGRIEAADGGTLFLDEIGEMPLGLQAKLLRFLESGELQRVGDNEPVYVDVRVIAATHRPIGKMMESGGFRADLYYRLAVFPIRVPPLAERMEDLPLLCEHFLRRLGEDAPQKRLGEQAMARLMEHAWPGNVRELAHVLERATILAGERAEISAGDIRL